MRSEDAWVPARSRLRTYATRSSVMLRSVLLCCIATRRASLKVPNAPGVSGR